MNIKEKIKIVLNKYCNAGVGVTNQWVKQPTGEYLVEIDLPDRFKTEWGIDKTKQINGAFKKMIKCASVRIKKTYWKDYLEIKFMKGEQNV